MHLRKSLPTSSSKLPEPQGGPTLRNQSDVGLSSSLVLKCSTQQAGVMGQPCASEARWGLLLTC